MATEQLFNLTRTTVASGGYTSGSGVLNVASTAAFPGTAQYHIAILDTTETSIKAILRVTGVNSATQFAVVAEIDANALISDHVVGEFWSAEAVTQVKADAVAAGALAAQISVVTDVHASRVIGTIYHNTNAYPLFIQVGVFCTAVCAVQIFTDSASTPTTATCTQLAPLASNVVNVCGWVLAGHYYKVAVTTGTPSLFSWYEYNY